MDQQLPLPLATGTAPPLPEGWEEHTDNQGKVYYANRQLQLSSWERPGTQQFGEVPPGQLDAAADLLERQDSAKKLYSALLNTSGNRMTPVLDQCFGAGKTSFVWKFRQQLRASVEIYTVSPGFEELQNAIYLHICFQAEDLSITADLTDGEFCSAVEKMICSKLMSALVDSSRSVLPSFSGILDLVNYLNGVCAGKKFLFHFDDIGAFEHKLSEDQQPKILYRIWIAAEQLRRRGHYFVLSGRSRFLHVIGTNSYNLENVSFESPNQTVLIPLNTLSEESAKSVFLKEGASEWVEKEGNLAAIHLLTGGVPRALVLAAQHLKLNPNATPDDDQLQQAIQVGCPSMFAKCDEDLFRHLVEMSWAGIEIDPEVQYINGEALTSILARFGLYTSSSGCENTKLRVIRVPLYQFRSQNWAPASLRSISQYVEPGERLEAGFRRVLCLRLSILDACSWDQIGLAYLAASAVPFPLMDMTDMFSFPKLASNATGNQAQAAEFMEKVHSHESGMDRQVFSRSFQKQLAKLMRIGQFYVPLPLSSSADAKMRIGETTMLDWQFKNFQNPITEETIKAEAEKCKIVGWTVHLVIFCSAGHSMNNGQDHQFMHKDVHVVALSQQSVEAFLGKTLLEKIQSTGLAADSTTRVPAVSTPLKKKVQVKRKYSNALNDDAMSTD